MEYRKMGATGLKLSALSLGSYATFAIKVDEREALDMVALAFDHGVNFFDNAESYAMGESERIMGRVLARAGRPRDSYCVSSKVFWGGEHPTQQGLSRKHIYDACHGALTRTGLDYLDLFYCHRFDPDTPLFEIVTAMDALVRQGKIRYWGTSEWPATKIRDTVELAETLDLIGPCVEQTQFNLLNRHRVEVEYALLARRGYALTCFSPLASGVLTGKYGAGIPEDSRMNHPAFAYLRRELTTAQGENRLALARQWCDLATELGCSAAALAIAWCLKNPTITTVLLGASSAAQLAENLGAAELVQETLEPAILKRIDQMVGHRPAQGWAHRVKARIRYLF